MLMMEYNRIKQQKSRSFKQEIRNDLLGFESNNPSGYCKLWKSLKIRSPNTSSLTLNKLDKYYVNQVQPAKVNYFDKDHMAEIEDFINRYKDNNDTEVLSDLSWAICNGSITKEDVLCHIDKVKYQKASGIDGIPGECIKHARDILVGPLHGMFNFLFNKGEWSEFWAEGLINPVHKKGSKDVENNYREVTVLPALKKVFESILNSRLTSRNLTLDMDDKFQC